MAEAQILQVEFCNGSALIACSDLFMYEQLSRYFRHCLGDKAPIIVSYKIVSNDDNALQLWRDDKLLHPKASPLYIFLFLSRDIITKLIDYCQHHLVFHAAGLVQHNTGLIVCGRSGRGKSTLSAWLTAIGFDFLSDEVVAIDLKSLEMTGLTCPIILKDTSNFVWQHWLGDDAEARMIQFFNGAAWFDPEEFRENAVCLNTQPQLAIFPHYQAGASLKVTPLSAAESSVELMHQLVNFKKLPNQGFRDVVRLAKHLSAYRLIYSDIEAATTWLKKEMHPKPNPHLV